MYLDAKLSTFQQFANSIPQLVWSASPDGTPFYANSRCIEYTGFNVADKQSGGWTECIHYEDRARVYECWTAAIASGNIFESEYRIRHHAGEYRWFLGRAVPIHDAEGRIQHWFGTGTDIEDYKRIEQELKDSRDVAENASRAKSVFLANMSHEIRTPLAAVLGFAELLADPKADFDEKHKCIESIRKNGDQLSALIDEILDLSKVESQKLILNTAPVSPRLLVGEVVDVLRTRAEQKNLRLEIQQTSILPEMILADAQRLRQILINIIGNAVKFTEKGEIQIELSAKPESGRQRLLFKIKDSGPGISVEDQRQLFQAFVQGDASMKRQYGGTGLGLALSQRLAEAMGGSVRIEKSMPGAGSVFVISILAEEFVTKMTARIPNIPVAAEKTSNPGTYLENKNILVVDDSEDNRFLVSWILKKSGAQIECAEDGERAVDMVGRKHYDAILMDIQMPLMDGFTACELVRGKGFTGPMIAITAHAMESDRERCLRSGFDEHLSKPLNPAKLQSTLQGMLET